MYIDSHCHFDIILKNKNITPESLFSDMKENGLSHAVQVTIESQGMNWSYDFAKKNREEGILFTLGIHPSSIAEEKNLNELSSFAETAAASDESDLLFGIGECGLDFYRMRQERKMQEASFRFQIELAKKYRLPLIIHSRDAMERTLEILKETKPERGIMHCFPGNDEEARKVLDLGLTISFAGNVTYKNAGELHRSASYVPLDRMIIETDAPFLTPVPFRGKKNLPWYVVNTYRFIADLKKVSLSKLEDAVYKNFMDLKSKESM
jgi:TatD DNase family protein